MQKNVLKHFFFLVELAQKYEDHCFIVRPHPSISCEQYKEKAKQLNVSFPDNVLFTKDFTIKEWIIASEVVGSSWSSSVWDAVNSGKRGFLFTPFKKPTWHTVNWEKYVANYTSSDQVDLYADTPVPKLESHKGGKRSSDMVCQVLVSLLDSSSSPAIAAQSEPTKYVHFRAKEVRSLVRYTLMRYFNGIGVKKGLSRDYFLPYFRFNLYEY